MAYSKTIVDYKSCKYTFFKGEGGGGTLILNSPPFPIRAHTPGIWATMMTLKSLETLCLSVHTLRICKYLLKDAWNHIAIGVYRPEQHACRLYFHC